jgi:hypothetical protein
MSFERYGMLGWREFDANRTDILSDYRSAKAKNSSRPVRTEHGPAGEAAVRKWLESFLPKKYGITSGFIVPDIIQYKDARSRHYDVIVYDVLNAPVLWTDGNADQSGRGKRRAIPAKYVRAVIECKAQFDQRSCVEAMDKLRELNGISAHFPDSFFSAVIFIELSEKNSGNVGLLQYLLPEPEVHRFWGGVILSCSLNEAMTGIISVLPNEGQQMSAQSAPDMPLAKDIDSLNIFSDDTGNLVIAEAGGGVTMVAGDNGWMSSLQYNPMYGGANTAVSLAWSASSFTKFAFGLLDLLDGISPADRRYKFGMVFEEVPRRSG